MAPAFAPPSAHYQVGFCSGGHRLLFTQGAGAEFSAVLAFCFGWMRPQENQHGRLVNSRVLCARRTSAQDSTSQNSNGSSSSSSSSSSCCCCCCCCDGGVGAETPPNITPLVIPVFSWMLTALTRGAAIATTPWSAQKVPSIVHCAPRAPGTFKAPHLHFYA